MANITRIKAGDSSSAKDKKVEKEEVEAEEITRKVSIKAKNSENKKVREAKKSDEKAELKKEKKAEKAKKKAVKGKKNRKSDEEVGYFRGAFREIRQVRWPDRKTTWKLTFTVIGYIIIFSLFLMLIDALFTFIFNKTLGGN